MGKQRITKKQKETIFIYRALSVRIFAFIMLLGGNCRSAVFLPS